MLGCRRDGGLALQGPAAQPVRALGRHLRRELGRHPVCPGQTSSSLLRRAPSPNLDGRSPSGTPVDRAGLQECGGNPLVHGRGRHDRPPRPRAPDDVDRRIIVGLSRQASLVAQAHRPPMPEGMQAQVPYIHRVVEAFGLPVVRAPGYEADDLIGTLARKAEARGFEVVIVTGDKDMFQLLSQAVRIYDPVKDRWFGEDDCRARFGVEPARVVEVMGLMGDATDNIPGVKGIGEKTAIKLIAEFGTIEELLRRVEEVTAPKIRALLVQQADNARLSRQLATIHVDCPVEFDPERFQVRPPPTESLVTVLRELEFPTLLKAIHPTSPAAPDQMLGAKADIIRDEAVARRVSDRPARGAPPGPPPVVGGARKGGNT